ncbi:hypothetical protein AB0C84_20100 [Actinomadura sp. NPDC048955]|uniref:hypothetical protein n=1 Tax=Actinomadura sp. NPDC048955 TaxID=3158228 RepID=UPI0033D935BF
MHARHLRRGEEGEVAQLGQARPGHHQVAASVTDPAWLAGVPADRPAVIVAEGLVQYLAKEQVAELCAGMGRRGVR